MFSFYCLNTDWGTPFRKFDCSSPSLWVTYSAAKYFCYSPWNQNNKFIVKLGVPICLNLSKLSLLRIRVSESFEVEGWLVKVSSQSRDILFKKHRPLRNVEQSSWPILTKRVVIFTGSWLILKTLYILFLPGSNRHIVNSLLRLTMQIIF